MCSGILGQRCGVLNTCVSGSEVTSCQHLLNKCFTCVDGFAGPLGKPTHGIMLYNEHGQFVCWLIKDPAESGLLPFDEVQFINGISADEFFDSFDPKAADVFELTVYRESVAHLISVAHTPPVP